MRFFDLGSMQDFKDATKEIASVDQGGLGLPEKDYYLRERSKERAVAAAISTAHHQYAAPVWRAHR